MFKKILVALDHSASSEQVFEEGLALAKAMQAQLMLVHVMTSHEDIYPISTLISNMLDDPPLSRFDIANSYIKELEAYEVQGLKMLHSHANIAIQQGLQADVQQPSGYAGCLLCDVARTWNADVIVMGRRSRNVLEKVFLGSISNYVNHFAPCSVLIVHNQDRPEASAAQQEKASIQPSLKS